MEERRGPPAPIEGVAQGLEPSPDAGRPPLITGPLLVRFVSVIGAEMSFFLPLSVVPLYVKSSGSGSDAGLATGALLLATVAAELVTRNWFTGWVTGCRWPPGWCRWARRRWL